MAEGSSIQQSFFVSRSGKDADVSIVVARILSDAPVVDQQPRPLAPHLRNMPERGVRRLRPVRHLLDAGNEPRPQLDEAGKFPLTSSAG
jgi:hypothetical protein